MWNTDVARFLQWNRPAAKRRGHAKVSAAPGSGSAGLQAAAEQNDVWGEMTALIDDLSPLDYGSPSRPLRPPETWGDSACRDSFVGNNDDCTARDRRVSVDDVAFDGIRNGENFFVLTTTFNTDYLKLLLASWNILYENLDLVQWAACWLTGNRLSVTALLTGNWATLETCLTNSILGSPGQEIYVLFTPLTNESFSGLPLGFTSGGTILIPDRSDLWQGFVELFLSSDPLERLCSVIELATYLAHELTHTCGYSFGDPWFKDGSDACMKSYLFENALRWALHRRYSDLAASCCSDLGSELFFGESDIQMSPYVLCR